VGLFNRNQLLKFLHVEPEEATIVFFTFLFALCVGISQNFMYSVPLSMFLSRYSSHLLPYIYICSGIATFSVSMGLVYLERTVSVFHVLTIPVMFLAVSLCVFWGALVGTDLSWIIIALLIWSWVVTLIMNGVLNVLFNQLFNLQQGKRLFGIMAGGVALGGVVSGFGLDFLVNTIGPNQVILLTACVLLLGLADQFLIKKYSEKRLIHAEESEETKASTLSFKAFQDKGYIVSVFLLTTIIYFMFFSFDYLFNTEVEKHFSNELEMAAFYGIVYALYDVGTLFVGFFLSNWILHKYGLIKSLIFLPLIVGTLLTFAFFANMIPTFVALVFSILVVTAILENTAREAIHVESTLLLFQPLRAEQRAWAQMKNEVSVQPMAMSVIGAILLVISQFFLNHVIHMALIIVGIAILAIILTLVVIKKGYIQLLVRTLSKRSLINPVFTKLDKDSLDILKEHLKSKYPAEVIYVLQTIENIDQNEFFKLTIETLDNPLEEVRCFCLKKIEQYRIKAAEEKVKQLCQLEKSPHVLGYAFLAWGAIGDSNSMMFLQSHLEDSNIDLASRSTIALIKYGESAIKEKAFSTLLKHIKSTHEEKRLVAAKALKDLDIPDKEELLLLLLQDSNVEVRLAACQSASHLSDERIYDALSKNLVIPHTSNAAFLSLLSIGEPIGNYIVRNFEHFEENVKIAFIQLLGFIKSASTSDFLQNLLTTSNRRFKYYTIQSLRKQTYKLLHEKNKKIIKDFLRSENDHIVNLRELLNVFCGENTVAIQSLLIREIELSQELCFLMLTFIYPEDPILKAMSGISSEDEDTFSTAVELLWQTLTPEDNKHFAPQLLFRPDSSLMKQSGNLEEGLFKVLSYAPQAIGTALSSAAVYTIGALKLTTLTDIVRAQKSRQDKDPYLKEIIPWTMRRLGEV
jgi:AAA family ATP:ADP antiporter